MSSFTDTAVWDLLRAATAAGSGHDRYVDARFVRRRSEAIAVRNGMCWQATTGDSVGLGVRARTADGWGFAATSQLSRARALDALARAQATPAAAPLRPLAASAPALGTYVTPVIVDPFAVDFSHKLGWLLEAEQLLRTDARILVTAATYGARCDEIALVTSEGTVLEQRIVTCGAGISCTAIHRGEVQHRSYPCPRGHWAQAGLEHVYALDLAVHAPRVAEESLQLLSAPDCPNGAHTVIIGGHQLAMQIHESVGHALELDRVLGYEAAYAGTSFVRPFDVGSLRYGSEVMNVNADPTMPGGLGTYGWDDEGVPAAPTSLVSSGFLSGFSSSRETAAAIGGKSSTGAMRADGWNRQPLVRMSNVNLEPGSSGSLEQLVSNTDDAIYLETNRSLSIDDRRLNFKFTTEFAREVKRGKWGRLYRNSGYRGVTPSFWAGLDAVCGPEDWQSWGTTECGKGEPAQLMMVSHATAPARFLNVDLVTTL
jgi:TldD protein